MNETPCPCGSGASEAACCAPIIAGAPAPTALTLMRSRYTAFVRGAIRHIVATHVAETRAQMDVARVTQWSMSTDWHGLEILATELGGETDDVGVVEFIVRGVTTGTPFAQRERSTFRREAGRWYYVDGVIATGATQPVRVAPTTGRNEPCPCGSGKKYKRCHAP